MYVDKTKQRLAQIDTEGEFSLFDQRTVSINGVDLSGLPVIVDDLEHSLETAGLFDIEVFTAIHGDLCFSNILFDLRNGIIKLIDPRGEFGSHVIHGDQRYDIAKLRHSTAGNYDFIISDLFGVEMNEETGSIEYEVYRDSDHLKREQLFDNLLKQKYPEWFSDVRLIESLLFLSMVPLHSDNLNRQRIMLARGIELFNDVVDL